MYHSDFKNVQTLIRVTKEITCPTTGVIKITIQYLIANFKSDAKDFYNKILQHWAVESVPQSTEFRVNSKRCA
jgi:predicted transposase YbfD/YdcC